MKVLQGQKHLTAIKFGAVISKALVLLNVHHQVASTYVLHHKVEASVRLEARVQRRQERMAFLVCHLVYSLFRSRTMLRSRLFALSSLGSMLKAKHKHINLPLDFVLFDNRFLLEDLDGKKFACFLLVFSQHDLSKVTLAENCQKVKIVQPVLAHRLR